MGTITPDELLKLWKLEKVTVEMAIGHILQNLIKVHAATETLDTSLYGLRGDVDALMAHAGIEPRSQGKRKARG